MVQSAPEGVGSGTSRLSNLLLTKCKTVNSTKSKADSSSQPSLLRWGFSSLPASFLNVYASIFRVHRTPLTMQRHGLHCNNNLEWCPTIWVGLLVHFTVSCGSAVTQTLVFASDINSDTFLGRLSLSLNPNEPKNQPNQTSCDLFYVSSVVSFGASKPRRRWDSYELNNCSCVQK